MSSRSQPKRRDFFFFSFDSLQNVEGTHTHTHSVETKSVTLENFSTTYFHRHIVPRLLALLLGSSPYRAWCVYLACYRVVTSWCSSRQRVIVSPLIALYIYLMWPYVCPSMVLSCLSNPPALPPKDLEGQLSELAEALRRRNPDSIASLIRAARPTDSQEMRNDGESFTYGRRFFFF